MAHADRELLKWRPASGYGAVVAVLETREPCLAGAPTAQALRVPRNLLSTSVAQGFAFRSPRQLP
jgi:hypothetical protein